MSRQTSRRKSRQTRGSATPAVEHTPHEIFEQIVRIWSKAVGVVRDPDEAWRRVAGLSIGTLTAAKLVLRLSMNGGLAFDGDAYVLDALDAESDRLAHAYFELVERIILVPGGHDGVLFAGERPYLRLVKNRTDFRWSREWVRDDEPMPLDTRRLDGAQPIAEGVKNAIMDYLMTSRAAVAHDPQRTINEFLSQLTSMMAAAKLILATWGNGKGAACLERLAEIMSEQEYAEIEAARNLP